MNILEEKKHALYICIPQVAMSTGTLLNFSGPHVGFYRAIWGNKWLSASKTHYKHSNVIFIVQGSYSIEI